MKVFVTGAGGFLGRAVTREAAASGEDVLALYRPASHLSGEGGGRNLRPVSGDLRQKGGWTPALQDAEAVIHCAAAASGDLATQLAGTVLATENLLACLPATLKRFIHISSLSVYDFAAPPMFGSLSEKTPLETRPLRRDAYTQTKLMQEELVRQHCRMAGIPLIIIRPGAIYGPGKDWDFGRSAKIGGFDLLFAPWARMRLIHVDDCARAIVAALKTPVKQEIVLNVIGCEQPSHWKFHRMARKAGAHVGRAIPIPYVLVRMVGGMARVASNVFFRGKARLPELLDTPRQIARWRNLRYPTHEAKHVLDWGERVSLREGLEQIVIQTKTGNINKPVYPLDAGMTRQVG